MNLVFCWNSDLVYSQPIPIRRNCSVIFDVVWRRCLLRKLNRRKMTATSSGSELASDMYPYVLQQERQQVNIYGGRMGYSCIGRAKHVTLRSL